MFDAGEAGNSLALIAWGRWGFQLTKPRATREPPPPHLPPRPTPTRLIVPDVESELLKAKSEEESCGGRWTRASPSEPAGATIMANYHTNCRPPTLTYGGPLAPKDKTSHYMRMMTVTCTAVLIICT